MLKELTADKIHIVCGHTDMRKSIDGLASIVQQQFKLDLFTNSAFLFCGRRRNRLKVLLWEGDGFLLLYKRLKDGRFNWPKNEQEVRNLTREQFVWLMQGLSIDQPKAIKQIEGGVDWFIPMIRKFWEYAFKEDVLNADETPIRVLKIDGKPTKKKGQMWIVCTGACASRKIALYTYRDSRTKDTAETLLGKDTGVVQTDGLQSYGSGDYENAGCWAHARRKFVDSIPKGVTDCPSAKIVALLDKAAKYERDAKEANYTEEQILEMRQNQVKPLLDQAYDIIHTLRPSKGSSLDAAVTYALNQKEKLYLFLDNPKVEMTNNLAERTVKPFVINRKNFLFCDTEKGADASAAVMSIIETAKRNQLDVYGYLLHLLTVLPEWGENPTDAQIESVMPWSLALPPFCKQTYSQVQ